MKKILIFLFLIILLSILYHFNVTQYLSLRYLLENKEKLQNYTNTHQLTSGIYFFIIYIIAVALSLPGATILTLAAGALFGFIKGTIMVSFASTIGATMAMFISRIFIRDWVKNKFSSFMTEIDKGISTDGVMYLFSLRLIPIFPFFVINLIMGVTKMSLSTFFLVSQLGMLPGTLVYVNAGTEINKIHALSDITSPTLILSFVFIGILPWISKLVLNKYKLSKLYSKWNKPVKFDNNLIVIGAGAAGLVTSYIAAAVKAKVTLIEANKMGGDCLNYGCVPSKALIKNAKITYQTKKNLPQDLTQTFVKETWIKTFQKVNDAITTVAPHDSKERYEGLGVIVKQGYAKLIDPWTVEIKDNLNNTSRVTGKNIVLATGARPIVPTIAGIESSGYLTSDTLWDHFHQLKTPPNHVLILGGGPIGCELSQAIARLGVKVTLIEKAQRVLIREDEDISSIAQDSLINSGVELLLEHEALRFEKSSSNQKTLVVKHGSIEKNIDYDEVIVALGRTARLSGFGLENIGINTNNKIHTNDYLETLYPNIFVAGDVVGTYQFTHTAAHQAWYAAVNALFGKFKKFKVDYSVIPWVTFLDPEIARVGLNENEAKSKGIAYEVTRFEMKELDRAITEFDTGGFIKVLTVPGKDRVLGVTIVSAHAGEQLSEFVLAMKYKLGLNKILATIHPYPTWNEANKYVAGEWKRNHSPKKLLEFLRLFHRWSIS
ncbi:MAG: FAD-dependent oxidoreductase [Betaproteobacteria bacterium]|nr:FAD-dependent oxidoreductase [Betaproteobacteria bacterium]